MRSEIRIAAAAALVIGIVACGDGATDPGETVPRVENIAAAARPTPPPGNLAQCYQGSDGVTESATCPVIKWNNVTYWAFAYENDPRNSLNLVAYNANEEIIDQQELTGTRQLYQITVNENDEVVTLFGFQANTAVVPWSLLVTLGGGE
jgi:hypothetical protein